MTSTVNMAQSASSATARTSIVSAPGKVLIAGGYLVLEPTFPGLVIATTSRFYSVVRRGSRNRGSDTKISSHPQIHEAAANNTPSVRVHSPQFEGATWEYLVKIDGSHSTLTQTRATYENALSGRNPFVGLAVLYAIRLALEARAGDDVLESLGQSGLDVWVLADNDFYSQRSADGASSSSQLRALPPFRSQDRPIRDVHKTGLGSSAAMTTSLVGSLLVHLGVVHADEASGTLGDEELALIHNTAQLAHCAAQGKVGSGFDVSAAVWGSQLYRRFDKEAIQSLLEAGEQVAIEGESQGEGTSRSVLELAPFLDPRNPLWRPSPLSAASRGETNPTAIEGLADGAGVVARPAPLELPPHVQIALADVDAGSNTPSMVGKILAWRKSKPEWALQMWSILASGNQTLADGLLALRLAHAQDSKAYGEAVARAAQYFSKDWDALAKTDPSPTLALLIEVRNALRAIQGGMRELGRQADVPVQPDEMSNVIKATVDGAQGVIGGGVPGAGGFDALFVLYLDVGAASDASSAAPTESTGTPDLPSPMAPSQQIEGVWSHWRALSIGPLLSKAGGAAGVASSLSQMQTALLQQGAPVGAQAQRGGAIAGAAAMQEAGGLRLHHIDGVPGLRSAIDLFSASAT